MNIQTGREPRLPAGGVTGVGLFDPESGQPIVYGTRVIGTPGAAQNDILFDIDMTGVMTALVQLTGTWVGTVSFETTIDETNWFSTLGFRPDNSGASAIIAATGNIVLAFPGIGKRLRARVSVYTSGTVNSSVYLTDVPVAVLPNQQNVTLSSGSNVVGSVRVTGASTSGATNFRINAASGVIRNAAASLYDISLFNTNAAARYLQLYNKASAGIPGTDTPVRTIGLGPGQSISLATTVGIAFSTGIGYAITSDAAGATIAAAGDIIGGASFL